ncbi:MAG: DUF4129 domain-containing protein [Steroidobacteraceae bacterium]
MRSRAECLALYLGLCLALALPNGAWAADPDAPTGPAANAATIGTYLSRDEIRAAAAKLRADPNLGGEKTLRTLRWKETNEAKAAPIPRWLTQVFDFLAQSSSLLLWIVGALCVGVAVVWAIRMLRERAPAAATPEPVVTSLHGLDIRPESLPEDIGAAALELLDAGREREALSLLYRGALSRAVHRHGIAIAASATEGEALRAVNATLDPPRAAYFAGLVALWQRTVYAGESVMREPIARLCRGFAESLEGATP